MKIKNKEFIKTIGVDGVPGGMKILKI